ncbi:hypothetical protein ACIQUY_34965 [Streptomyces sp. NPDC090231]|uniref:hypothetical protein n=1 Tax=unclassified Streptomyces TaxID=2593676 RepID=UPI002E120A42|nr:hypothetical protein OG384_36555 [Streptomyces sp. NBC_01324]
MHGTADDPVSTSSHFVKNPGKEHGPRYLYDLERRGKELVDSSGSTVVRKDCQWRLICPPPRRPVRAAPGKKPSGRAPGERRPAAGTAKVTNRQAGRAIASARRIVRFLDAFRAGPGHRHRVRRDRSRRRRRYRVAAVLPRP